MLESPVPVTCLTYSTGLKLTQSTSGMLPVVTNLYFFRTLSQNIRPYVCPVYHNFLERNNLNDILVRDRYVLEILHVHYSVSVIHQFNLTVYALVLRIVVLVCSSFLRLSLNAYEYYFYYYVFCIIFCIIEVRCLLHMFVNIRLNIYCNQCESVSFCVVSFVSVNVQEN